MEIQDALRTLSEKIVKFKDQIETEEATKTAFVMPFFSSLGYDISNPLEFVPEYTADFGYKKGSKVDYAIIIDNNPVILIEAKPCNSCLEKHDAQLMMYYASSKARIGILTNGIEYKFYTDLEEQNKMDERPFMEINMLDLKDNEINELKKYSKASFDMGKILSTAEELKYSNAIKKAFSNQVDNPDDSFIEFFINMVYEGKKTKHVKEKFETIVRKSISDVMNDMVRNRIEVMLKKDKSEGLDAIEAVETEQDNSRIVTTDEELMAYNIARSMLVEHLDLSRVSYKDTIRYFNVLIDGKVTRWIVRFYFNSKVKYITFPCIEGNGREERCNIEDISDIFHYKGKLLEVLNHLNQT